MLLVLWDIDGTLVDSAGHGRRAFEEAFEAVMGVPPADYPGIRETWTSSGLAGRTDHQIAQAMLGEAHDRLPRMLEELAAALGRRAELIRAEGHPHPGAREALEALARRNGVVQSLLTGNLEANAAVKLAAFGLERLVDLEVGGYGSDPHSARSDLVAVARRKAAAKYAEAARTVLIGDTPLDVRAAHEAGARAVAVATGPYGVDELRASGADAVLSDLRDTAAVLRAVGA